MAQIAFWVTLGCLAIWVAIIGLEVEDDAWYDTNDDDDSQDDQDDD